MNWYYNSFPQSAGQLFSWYILLHSVYIISTELSSPACIISAVMLSLPGDFLFFRLPTAASTSSLSMSSICSCLLQGGISCNIVLSTGLVSLYSFSKYSFHLFLISVLLSSSSHLCLISQPFYCTHCHRFPLPSDITFWCFASLHCRLLPGISLLAIAPCIALPFFFISRVTLLYLFLLSSLCVFVAFIALLWLLILNTSCEIHGFCFFPFLVPNTCCATSVYMDLMSSQVSSTLSLFFFFFVCSHLLFSRVLYSLLTKLSSSLSISNFFPDFSLCIVFSLTFIPAITRL